MKNFILRSLDGLYTSDNELIIKFKKFNEDQNNQFYNPYYNLYAYVSQDDNKLYIKFGKADNTVYNRYKNTEGREHLKYMVGLWHIDKIGNEAVDKPIHNKLSKYAENKLGFIKESKTDGDTETYLIENKNGILNFIDKIESIIKSKNINEKYYQELYKDTENLIDEVVSDESEYIQLDLCPRYGKTRTLIEILKKSQNRVAFLSSYIGTVRTSYKNTIDELSNYNNIRFFDPDFYNTTQECLTDVFEWLNSDISHKCIYYVALTGSNDNEINTFERRTSNIEKLDKYGCMTFVEEADFGAECDKQIKKLNKLFKFSNKIITTTGTNADKANSIFGKNDIKKYFRGYISHVLKDNERSKNAVNIKWNILNNNHMVENLGIPKNEMENFSDMLRVSDGKLSNEVYFRQVLKYLYHKLETGDRKMDKVNLVDTNGVTMIFTGGNNESHVPLKNLIEDIFGYDNVLVKILDGDYTSNADAELEVKDAIADLGNRKMFLIAAGMCNRSFSIKEISNIILFTNGGSYSSIYQKIARGLTPGYSNICNIIDFRLEYKCCADVYIQGEAINEYNENHNISDDLKEFIDSSDKIIFCEYFKDNENFFYKLNKHDLETMIESNDFQTTKIYSCYNKIIENVERPNILFNIFGEKIEMNTKFGKQFSNIKGDNIKKQKTDKINTYSDKEKKEKEYEENLLLKHLCWFNENYYVFNTESYEGKDWLKNEFEENMPDIRKKLYEQEFNIDMNTICGIANELIKAKINIE